MSFDATFWVAISFIIFFGLLVYFKIPQKILDILNNMILDIQKEISESEKLRLESKKLLENSQNKLDTAKEESLKIISKAREDGKKMIIDVNEKFHTSTEIKKNLTKAKILQMKEQTIKEIKNTSINLAIDTAKKVILEKVDQAKLDALFEKNLDDAKKSLKKINS